MQYRALTPADRVEWACLLAQSFDRTQEQMEQLIGWFHAGFRLVTWGAWDGYRGLLGRSSAEIAELRALGVL